MAAINRETNQVPERTSGYGAAFDRLFERGREAVLAGVHYCDTSPVDGGRWGMSVVFRPDPATAAQLAEATEEALAVAGPGHWPTGAPPAVHFTVRAIEPHRSQLSAGDPVVQRCAAAVTRAADRSRPARLRLRGLTLTPSGLMACGWPVDTAADDFAVALGEELGEDGWFERGFVRDIWYATLVHFTGPLVDPAGLVDWVAARRSLGLGQTLAVEAELLSFRFDGRQPVRQALAAARFGTHCPVSGLGAGEVSASG